MLNSIMEDEQVMTDTNILTLDGITFLTKRMTFVKGAF